jgi:hypothetical protein
MVFGYPKEVVTPQRINVRKSRSMPHTEQENGKTGRDKALNCRINALFKWPN